MNILPLGRGDVPPTVNEIAALYLESLELRHLAGRYDDRSLERVRRYLRSFAQDYGGKVLSQCSNSDLLRWMASHPEWQSDFTRQDAITSIMVCFHWAVDEGLVATCPYRRPKGLTFRLRPREAFTADDFKAVLRATRHGPGYRSSKQALRCALHFLWRTGARTCEMRHALWGQIDWTLGALFQVHHKTDLTGEDRAIGLEDGILRLLRWMRATSEPDKRACSCPYRQKKVHTVGDHCFRNGRHDPWTVGSFAALFRDYARRAGIDESKSAYSLRHGFCVQAIVAGVGERQIADQLGHSSTRYIAWYGRKTRHRADHLRNVAKRARRRPDAS